MDLRDELKAAMAGDGGSSGAENAPEPVIEGTAALVAETPPAAEPPAASTEPPAGAPERDESGRFKPKTDIPPAEGAAQAAPVAEANTETAKPAGQEPQPEAIRVPPSLPAAVKAKFANLDPDVRDAFVTLEDSVQKAKAEWGGKGQRLNRFDEVIGPHLPRWQMAGLDEISGIQSLLAAQTLLDQNPVNGLVQIARSYGLTPAHLAQAFGLSQASAPNQGAEGQQAPTGSPDFSAALQQHLSPLVTQVQTLQQQLSQSQQAGEAAKLAEAQSTIEAFAADPKNMYFHNVQDAVYRMISADRQAGGSMTLQQAYDGAVWADPTIRPHLLADQAKATAAEQARAAAEATKAAEKAQRDKAEAARKAGGSVTGSPTPGAQAPAGAPGSVRDQLRSAMQEHGAL